MRARAIANSMLAFSLISICLSPLLAQQASPSDQRHSKTSQAESDFYRAYYLHHEKGDLGQAKKAYESSLKRGINGELKQVVKNNLVALQEDLATSDFAQLMPADALAYIEFSRPGHHIEEVARMMGMTGRTFDPDYKPVRLNLDGLAISSDFQISPALLREMKKFRGIAASVSGVNQEGMPTGVAIIHPGDSDLLTGLVETGIQLVPTTDRIGGFPTFQIENQVWLVKTNRLIFAATSKAEIESCLSRLNSNASDSLAQTDAFQAARERHGNAAFFAFTDPKVVMKKMAPMLGQEAAIAAFVLDTNHMRYIAASTSSTQRGVATRINVAMEEGHNSMAYGLFRTVPLTRTALSHVPENAAVVAGLGLNPKLAMAAEAAGDSHITALDIGRELFANIEEVGMFVLPQMVSGNNEVPEFGLIFTANNVEKSKALWNHLLSLPEKMQLEDGPASQEVVIGGVKGMQYSFSDDDIPTLAVIQLDDNSMIAGTTGAVAAAIATRKSGKSFANSDSADLVWGSENDQPAKVITVNVARAMELAAQFEDGGDRQTLQVIGKTLGDLSFTMVSNETPTEFEFKFEAANLPQFEAILKTVARMEQARPVAYERAIKVEEKASRPTRARRAESSATDATQSD